MFYVFRVKVENEGELVEAIVKVTLKLPYSQFEETEFDRFMDFLDEDRRLDRFISKLEGDLEEEAREKIEAFVKRCYHEFKSKSISHFWVLLWGII